MWRFSVCTRVKSSSQWLIQTGISTEMLCLYSFKEGLVTGPLLPSEEGPCLLWKGLRGPLCAGFRSRSSKARGRASPSRSGAMCVQMGPFSTGHLGSPSIPGSGLTWAGAVGASPESWEGQGSRTMGQTLRWALAGLPSQTDRGRLSSHALA